MNLLFDLKTPQHFIGGGSEYIRKVYFSLLSRIEDISLDTKIYALYDSRIGRFAYEDLSPAKNAKKNVCFVDIASSSLHDVIEKLNIDKVFIGCGQFWRDYDVEQIKCPVICVLHDLCDEEYEVNNLSKYVRLNNPYRFIKHLIGGTIRDKRNLKKNVRLMQMLKTNEFAKIVTVSEYSKSSIMFNYEVPENKIHVLYSPQRVYQSESAVECDVVRDLIETKKKYYVMISCNRIMKNAHKAIRAFAKYVSHVEDEQYLVTIGYSGKKITERQIVLPYLSDGDLENLIKNCYAFVFPSLFEGFGYPPVEAMKFGKPVLCSNTTSMPEIVGDAAISFSPFYETDIYRAFCSLNKNNYNAYSEKSTRKALDIENRQKKDLDQLIDLILY